MKLPSRAQYRLTFNAPHRRHWIKRERDTALMVRLCCGYLIKQRRLTAETIDALCRLTWITKYRGALSSGYVASTKLPALKTIFGLRDNEQTLEYLFPLISQETHLSQEEVETVFGAETGIVNLYTAYRNQVAPWLRRNRTMVTSILTRAYSLNADANAYAVMADIERLKGIPSAGRHLGPEQVLTPVVACLDPRRRFPIVNKGSGIRKLLAMLKFTRRSLTDKFDALTNMIGPGFCEDAFELDRMAAYVILLNPPRPLPKVKGSLSKQRDLSMKDEHDIEFLLASKRRVAHLLHNNMTNVIRQIYRGTRTIVEGTGADNRFDILVKNYKGTGKHLLIEVKSSVDLASARLAVGQLFDYRRFVPDRLATQMAVLFPAKPGKHVCDLLGEVGITPLWFTNASFRTVATTGDQRFCAKR